MSNPRSSSGATLKVVGIALIVVGAALYGAFETFLGPVVMIAASTR
jgi:hypothetical protein